MLIEVPEHSARDLEAWRRAERQDQIVARSQHHLRRVERSMLALAEFASRGPCYCGVSWGKDSVVTAHLVIELARNCGPVVPLVWVRVEPICNPHCALVRDAFLSMFPGHPYDEIRSDCWRDSHGWHASGTLERGMHTAEKRYGKRHVSGVRGQESATRQRRCMAHGESTERTCAPLAWWTSDDVYAYLHAHGLPVHPAYAMSIGGMLDRGRLRVSSLGGKRGTGHGRLDWERRYYPDKMRELGEY